MKLPLVTFALLLGFVVSCSKPAPGAQYTVNGKIVGVGAKPGDKIDIHHERIADYKSREGKVAGMDSMVMSFAPSASMPPVAVGDIVRVTFTVHFDSDPGLRIVTIEKLPADTTLVLQ